MLLLVLVFLTSTHKILPWEPIQNLFTFLDQTTHLSTSAHIINDVYVLLYFDLGKNVLCLLIFLG
jgi:hypothetical protein